MLMSEEKERGEFMLVGSCAVEPPMFLSSDMSTKAWSWWWCVVCLKSEAPRTEPSAVEVLFETLPFRFLCIYNSNRLGSANLF
jgi:hypothetical protein